MIEVASCKLPYFSEICNCIYNPKIHLIKFPLLLLLPFLILALIYINPIPIITQTPIPSGPPRSQASGLYLRNTSIPLIPFRLTTRGKQIFDLPRQVRSIFTSLIDLYPYHNHIRHNISLNTRHAYHFQPINTLYPGGTVNRQFRSKY